MTQALIRFAYRTETWKRAHGTNGWAGLRSILFVSFVWCRDFLGHIVFKLKQPRVDILFLLAVCRTPRARANGRESQHQLRTWRILMETTHEYASPIISPCQATAFLKERKERTPWKASRAQRRKRSRGRFWRIWVFFTPAIPGKHGKTVLPAHIVLSSYSMFHIFLWPRPSQDPCFWPNVAAGSQEQRRKQRLLVFSSFFGYFLLSHVYLLKCVEVVAIFESHHCSGSSCGGRVAFAACRMQMPALLRLRPFHNAQHASICHMRC